MRRLLVLTLLALAGCTSWRPVATHERWTLYERPERAVGRDRFAAAFEPAFAAVEEVLGPFERRVDVHAWEGQLDEPRAGARSRRGVGTGVHQVPGIGPARIQAYHARAGGAFGRSGVFIGAPDPGTAVHELVHARFAELDTELPLWFEEGLAGLLGDGVLIDGRWQVDGLACWPRRELAEEALSDADLERLLSLEASDRSDVRDNVLVHFVGWAVVFDLYRESGGRVEWRRWLEELEAAPVGEIRRRIERSLATSTLNAWLGRLEHPDPAVRLATAKGLWKLRSRRVLAGLLRSVELEPDPEVRVGLAVNLLAAAGELSLSWRRWREVEGAVRGALRAASLADPREQRAANDLYRAYRRGNESSVAQTALEGLARFWEE